MDSQQQTSSSLSTAQAAKAAFEASQLVSSEERVKALHAIRDALATNKDAILAANKEDLEAAQVEVDTGRMSEPLLKRLDLGKGDKWDSMLQGVLDVANLPDPNGNVSYASELDDELELYRVSCPIGVLLIIFESRPEVVVNIASLAIKSGNAAILKGGKESSKTAGLLAQAISSGLSQTALSPTYIQVIQTREEVSSLLSQDRYIDLVIPRGSNSLVRSIQNSTRIPVMGHADGLCSVYLDETAEFEKAIRVVVDSKTDYPSACNSAETLLVHQSLLKTIWPVVARALIEANVQLLCDEPSLAELQQHQELGPLLSAHVKQADEHSFTTEFLAMTMAVKVVPSIKEAMEWINSHSSHHTDSIVTESEQAASVFVRGVDSAGTFVNASTRFADGFRYGFGTEVGISTGRIHARGPVGLEGLVIYKYMLRSRARAGHVASEFGAGKKNFKHAPIQAKSVPF